MAVERSAAAHVERILRALDDDSPEYRELIAALAHDAEARRELAREPELGLRLFPELRKLRPVSLWVRDRATLALPQKRALVLDGAICRLAAGEQLPAPEGRECWLEVDAASAETTLRALPSGWGVIVTGELSVVSFDALRRAAPLRALGAVFDPCFEPPPTTRLDLVLMPEPPPEAAFLARAEPGAREMGTDSLPSGAWRRAARTLWSCSLPPALQLPRLPTSESSSAHSAGVLSDAENALFCALLLPCNALHEGPYARR